MAAKSLTLTLPLVLALAACSPAKPEADPNADRDPAAAAALNDPVMVDPDLASQNRGNSALSGGGPAMGDLPNFKRTPEEASAARLAAREWLGGEVVPAPAAALTVKQSKLAGALTAQALAEASGLGGKNCAERLEYSLIWAARLPTALPVYPRGHALMAGGSDAAGCKLRVVRFVTPVELNDVVDFYHAAARRAKLGAEHRREGDDEAVSGNGYAAYARKRSDGLTEVDLITSGL